MNITVQTVVSAETLLGVVQIAFDDRVVAELTPDAALSLGMDLVANSAQASCEQMIVALVAKFGEDQIKSSIGEYREMMKRPPTPPVAPKPRPVTHDDVEGR